MNFIILSSIVLSFSVSAYDPHSAYRNEKISYKVYEKKALEASVMKDSKLLRSTPLGSSRKFDEANIPAVTSWRSVEDMMARFQSIRDERFLEWRRNPEVLRRSSWLYPDDGCYARASLANRNVFRWFHPVPNKVFAFGNLKVKTTNSPRGAVWWWYHVAPIVQVGETKYVLDPAINFDGPLPLRDWLSRMGQPEKIKVAICSSGTYTPGDDCSKTTDGIEMHAERAQQSYLDLEWNRLKRLGRENEL